MQGPYRACSVFSMCTLSVMYDGIALQQKLVVIDCAPRDAEGQPHYACCVWLLVTKALLGWKQLAGPHAAMTAARVSAPPVLC